MNLQYVYLIQEREFVQSGKPVFKIGKSKQLNFERFKQYPKGSVMIHQSACINCDECEKEIILFFRKKYTQRNDIGAEYFEGDYNIMLRDILILSLRQWNDSSENKTENSTLPIIVASLLSKPQEEVEPDILSLRFSDPSRLLSRYEISNTDCKIQGQKLEYIEISVKEGCIFNSITKPEDTSEILKFSCEICKFSSMVNGNLQKHLLSKKHLKNVASPESNITNFKCLKCDRYYRAKAGLCKHVIKCGLRV
jgi:hypothetical protein